MRISDWSSDVCSSDLLVVLGGVADEVAVAVRHVLRRPVDVARAEGHALVRADPEVELSGDDEPELLVGRVAVVGGRPEPLLDAPEAERQDRKSTRLNSSH